jgi:hypothetical protein
MEVWLSPPIAPITTDDMMVVVINKLFSIEYDISINGATF